MITALLILVAIVFLAIALIGAWHPHQPNAGANLALAAIIGTLALGCAYAAGTL